MVRTTFLATLVACSLAAFCGAATAHAAMPKLLVDVGNYFKYRPHLIEMCGTTGCPFDGYTARRAYQHRIHWLKWTRHMAVARVTQWRDDCVPNCAAGTFRLVRRGTITASHPNAYGHFTRMALTYRRAGR